MKVMALKKKVKAQVPAATIRGTYNTYEDRTRKQLVDSLGHVVDLDLEDKVSIEIGGWGTGLKMFARKGVKVSVESLPDGRTKIYLTRV